MVINSEYRHEKEERSVKRDRYWSVMLVGDHGRIIPFRRFKGIAISVVGGLVLAVLVIIGLSIAYMLQASTIDELEVTIEESNRQIAKLRDEKDLLLAKLVVNNKRPIKEKKSEPPISDNKGEKEDSISPKPEKQTAAAVPKPSSESTPVTEKTPDPPVQLNADIRRFNIKYLSKQNLLRCDFRIYNTSKPKRPLAGRSVVVFKNMDEPPIKWLAVPRGQLADGVPNGKYGKFFEINNYRTMTFRAYGLKPPVRFNAASVYVYTKEGTLLLNREIPINIDVPAPLPHKPEPLPLRPTGSEQPSEVAPDQSADDNETESVDPSAQRPNPSGEPKIQGE